MQVATPQLPPRLHLLEKLPEECTRLPFGQDKASGAKKEVEVPDFIRDYVTWGAGPRATQFLILAAKARAVLHGRYYVSCEDVRAVAPPVLRHRIITNFNAEAEGIKPDDIVRRLIDRIPRDPNEQAAVGAAQTGS